MSKFEKLGKIQMAWSHNIILIIPFCLDGTYIGFTTRNLTT